MEPSSRDRFSVDLCGLKVAVLERAAMRGVSPSALIRAAVAAALEVPCADAVGSAGRVHNGSSRIRICLRLPAIEAQRLVAQANAIGLPVGTYIAGLSAGMPALMAGERPSRVVSALSASNAELAVLSKSLRHLTALLKRGDVEAARPYRQLLDQLGTKVHDHLELSARALATLSPDLKRGGLLQP